VGSVKGDSNKGGLAVDQVMKGSAAAHADLRAGDRIVAVNGEAVNDLFDLRWVLDRLHKGDTAKVTVERAGARQTVTATF